MTHVELPPRIRACLFDLDGVLTQTATLHAEAWKLMFDRFLAWWASRDGQTYEPFDAVHDYEVYVDGRSRLDGVRTFLASRDIVLPDGHADDVDGAPTVHGLSNAKNRLFNALLDEMGAPVFGGSISFARAARETGRRLGVVSSSANTRRVLAASHLSDLFEVVVDAQTAEARSLAGKPAADTFLAAADALGVAPADAAVFEDALAGVEAARAGNFGLVVGVDRVGQADALRASGADIVVADLSELLDEP